MAKNDDTTNDTTPEVAVEEVAAPTEELLPVVRVTPGYDQSSGAFIQ